MPIVDPFLKLDFVYLSFRDSFKSGQGQYTPDGITGGQFLCQACCQNLEGQKVSLKELVAARNKQRREEQTQLKERKRAVEQARVPKQELVSNEQPHESQKPVPYISTFKPPHFMVQLSPEFVRGK